MTYTIRQKIKGKVYVYEVKSYWDPKKKQARQKRRYIGSWDESTGKISPKISSRLIRTTKIFGSAYLLDMICDEIGLKKKLCKAFGDDGYNIIAAAMARVISGLSLKNMHHTIDDSFISEMYPISGSFSSQWLSGFLERLSLKESQMAEFYSSLTIGESEAVAYDITSLSSESANINWLEYGYNRDNSGLPQINMGLVMSLKRKIPLYFKIFPGSINDVSTLKNLLCDIKRNGIVKCLLILDKGFYSEENIREMISAGMDFIIPLPFSVKAGKALLSSTNKAIDDPGNAKRHEKEIFYVIEDEIQIAEKTIHAYIMHSKKRESMETSSFFNRLMDIENSVNGKKAYGNPLDFFKNTAGNFSRYFDVHIGGGIISLRRRQNAISQAINRFGKTILLSSNKQKWSTVLSYYREKDAIEKEFDMLKNELDALPLRVRKLSTLKGILFILFVSMIIRSLLLKRAGEAALLEKNSASDILLELGKLRAVNIGGTWRLSEITKKQRDILERMGISIPVEPIPRY